jgi:hypothetical protein
MREGMHGYLVHLEPMDSILLPVVFYTFGTGRWPFPHVDSLSHALRYIGDALPYIWHMLNKSVVMLLVCNYCCSEVRNKLNLRTRNSAFCMIAFYEDRTFPSVPNPLNAEINSICHLLVLLGAHPILHISRIRVKVVDLLSPTNTVHFFGRCPSPKIKNTTFRKPALLPSSGKEAPKLVDSLDRAVRVHCAPHKYSAS